MSDIEREKRAEKAAQLVAAGKLNDDAIAAEVGISRVTLWKWRKHPKFIARVDKLIDDACRSLRRRAISHVENRVSSLNTRWLKLHEVIEARGNDPDHTVAPGGDTGLLVRSIKKIGSGEDAELVTEFAVDTGLLKELREIEKQAATELGQWAEKIDHTSGGQPIKVQVYLPDNRRDDAPTELPGTGGVSGE